MVKIRKRSRSALAANKKLGVVLSETVTKQEVTRDKELTKRLKYYDNKQYENLIPWNEFREEAGAYHISDVEPSIKYPFAKNLSNKVMSKLGYPKVSVEDDPDFEYLIKLAEKTFNIKSNVKNAIKKIPVAGSAFIRFFLENGRVVFETYSANYCYPELDSSGEIESIEIKYLFDDDEDLDSSGRPKKKWRKMEFNKQSDIIYNTPEYRAGEEEPTFIVDEQIDHKLGFVQGVWFRSATEQNEEDGEAIVSEDLMEFIDEFNRNLSRTADAVQYGTDPQLLLKGMDEDEIEDLIKSTLKGWALGRDGEAGFLEAGGSGVQNANDFRKESLEKYITDIARIVLLDPEKIVGSAQSAKAMEVLHGPMVDLINEIRPYIETGIQSLYQKIMALILIQNKQGGELMLAMPEGYVPASFSITFTWPPIFPLTPLDKQQIISNGVQLSNANILSRETTLKWIQAQIPDIPIDDIQLEIQRINNQPQLGGFFGGF